MNNDRRIIPSIPSRNAPLWIAAGAGLFLVYAFTEMAEKFSHGNWIGGNPGTVIFKIPQDAMKGRFHWSFGHTAAAVVVFFLIALVIGGIVFWQIKHPVQKGAAKASKHLGQGKEMTLRSVSERSDKSRLTTGEVKGLFLVNAIVKGKDKARYADWRQTGVIVAGPGATKTTGFGIPMSMGAPGVVFATTNKRDLADGLRGARIGKTWVFDPQRICSRTPPPWRLDLRNYITDEVRAHKLAKIWMDASTPLGSTKNSYFDSAGPNLLAGLLLAWSLTDKQISQVFLWLNDPMDQEPVKILERNGFMLPAQSLYGVYTAPEEQRAGVFGTAAEMVSFLNNSRTRSWLEETPGDVRPVFSPENFVRSGNEMMIAVSKEGIGSTGPLTAALTIWVLDAAEELADDSPHGRLQIPMVVVLDEVANVCRLKELPDLMSHYGSRGISIWPILQNFAQGKRVWGEDGMEQLWSAANIRIVGSGQADTRFLESLSKALGNRLITEYSTGSSSNGGMMSGGSSSVNASQRKDLIMDIEDLMAMEPGEFVVYYSGGRPYVAKSVPWYERPEMAELVSASIAKHEPKGVLPIAVS